MPLIGCNPLDRQRLAHAGKSKDVLVYGKKHITIIIETELVP
jgi:hypothetical protein